MSLSTIDKSASRAAIMTWRDNASLEVMAIVHEASVSAMRALEVEIDSVGWADVATDAEGAARAVVRPAMRDALKPSIEHWFVGQRRALAGIDARLSVVAQAFSAVDARPVPPIDPVAAASAWGAPDWLRGSLDTLSSAVERVAGEVASRALPDAVRSGAERLSVRMGQEIGALSGAHVRLRAGGRIELSRAWLGSGSAASDERTYLTQLLDLVDRTAVQAKEQIG